MDSSNNYGLAVCLRKSHTLPSDHASNIPIHQIRHQHSTQKLTATSTCYDRECRSSHELSTVRCGSPPSRVTNKTQMYIPCCTFPLWGTVGSSGASAIVGRVSRCHRVCGRVQTASTTAHNSTMSTQCAARINKTSEKFFQTPNRMCGV